MLHRVEQSRGGTDLRRRTARSAAVKYAGLNNPAPIPITPSAPRTTAWSLTRHAGVQLLVQGQDQGPARGGGEEQRRGDQRGREPSSGEQGPFDEWSTAAALVQHEDDEHDRAGREEPVVRSGQLRQPAGRAARGRGPRAPCPAGPGAGGWARGPPAGHGRAAARSPTGARSPGNRPRGPGRGEHAAEHRPVHRGEPLDRADRAERSEHAGPVNIARISPMVCGMITAADAPARPGTRSTRRRPARAHASEVSRNAGTPSGNTRRRLARSPGRPPVISSAVNGRV